MDQGSPDAAGCSHPQRAHPRAARHRGHPGHGGRHARAAAAGRQGRPGEFDFLAGEWRVAHRMLQTPTGSEWLEFGGEATCWTILGGGGGSVEDLRVPSRNFRGLGLRLLDVGAGVWSDFWGEAASGVLTTPSTTGGFADGVGTFTSEDAGTPVQVRGV